VRESRDSNKPRGRRRRLGYANVVATVALVFAMSGGAFAASKYLLTSTKQIKPSVLAKLKGNRGPAVGATTRRLWTGSLCRKSSNLSPSTPA
jgi:hypothetical protein